MIKWGAEGGERCRHAQPDRCSPGVARSTELNLLHNPFVLIPSPPSCRVAVVVTTYTFRKASQTAYFLQSQISSIISSTLWVKTFLSLLRCLGIGLPTISTPLMVFVCYCCCCCFEGESPLSSNSVNSRLSAFDLFWCIIKWPPAALLGSCCLWLTFLRCQRPVDLENTLLPAHPVLSPARPGVSLVHVCDLQVLRAPPPAPAYSQACPDRMALLLSLPCGWASGTSPTRSFSFGSLSGCERPSASDVQEPLALPLITL